jgi:hypothetical protein
MARGRRAGYGEFIMRSRVIPAALAAIFAVAIVAPAAAQSPVFPAKVDAKYDKETPARARLKTCADQYKANKAKNANAGLNWIQKGGGYWSQCNKKLKG